MTAPATVRLQVPFLGLHYFDEEHQQLFFGRDEQLRDLLAKLADSRFVTVIGSSGTGKSSLARAGLVPALRAGFFTAAGPKWRIAKIRPGSSPIWNLAREIESVFAGTGVELTLRRGPLGIVEAARQCGLRDDENLLIMVDQFEEIFRYQREAGDRQTAAEETAAFVKLLLEATARVEPAIFVLITMRSDYLGACAQFRDLPERINTGLYLIPRMRRDQLQEAITGPAAVAGASFSPALVQRLLNDAGEDPDQLPVLQHALLRTWLNWQQENNSAQSIDFRHYEATGGVRDGLDNHAEEIYGHLDAQQQKTAEVLFRCLTERDPSNNDIRRPTCLHTIAAVAGVPAPEVARVADAFRAEGVSFLTPTPPAELHEDTLIDITHESLIRKWYRLRGSTERKGWVQHEAELREQYRDLVKRARRAREKRGVLTGVDLADAVAWQAQHLEPGWALRYESAPDAFPLVQEYIARSVKVRRRQKVQRVIAAITAAIAFVAGVGFLHWEQDKRDEAKREFENSQRETGIWKDAQEALLKKQEREAQAAAAEAAQATEQATEEAERTKALATARQLSTDAQGLKDSPELGTLLALESLNRNPLPEATGIVSASLGSLTRQLWSTGLKQPEGLGRRSGTQLSNRGRFNPSSYPLLQFSSDGRYLARVSESKVHLYDATKNGREIPVSSITGDADSLAWSENQLFVLTGLRSDKGTFVYVYVISAVDGSAKQVFEKQCRGLCLLTPDGKYLMITSNDATGTGQLHPLAGGGPLDLEKGGAIRALGFAGDILREAQGQNAGEQKESEQGHIEFSDAHNESFGNLDADLSQPFDLGRSEAFLAVTGRNGAIRIFRTRPRVELVAELPSAVNPTALALSPDGHLIAIGDGTGRVRLVDWAVQSIWESWTHSSPVTAIAFSANTIASMDASGGIRVFPALINLQNAEPRGVSTASHDKIAIDLPAGNNVFRASFAGSEKFLLVSGFPTDRVFNTELAETVLPTLGSQSRIVISSDGRYAVLTDSAGKIGIADLNVASKVKTLDMLANVTVMAVGPGARYLVTADKTPITSRAPSQSPQTAGLRIFDSVDLKSSPLLIDSRSPIRSLSAIFSPEGHWLLLTTIAPNTTSVYLLQPQDGRIVNQRPFEGRFSTQFSPDGRFLFLFSRSINPPSTSTSHHLVDTHSMKEVPLELADVAGLNAVQFSPDGHLVAVATGEDGMVRLFNPQTGQFIKKFETGFAAELLGFNPSSRYLAVGSPGNAPRVFDLQDGIEFSRVARDEKETILALHFSQDGRRLVVASSLAGIGANGLTGRPVKLLIKRQFLFAKDLVREACARVGRNLTREEWKAYLPDYPYEGTCPGLPVPNK